MMMKKKISSTVLLAALVVALMAAGVAAEVELKAPITRRPAPMELKAPPETFPDPATIDPPAEGTPTERNEADVLMSAAATTGRQWSSYVGRPLGMESRAIHDSQISGSSCYAWDCGVYGPQWGRLNNLHYYGGWLGYLWAANEWFQVDLGRMSTVAAIATQGCNHGNWVPAFTIHTSTDGSNWTPYTSPEGQHVLPGNVDHVSVKRTMFEPAPLKARFLRLTSYQAGWTCLRMELYSVKDEVWEGGEPLGLSTGSIGDSALSASSSHGNNWYYYGPQHARLYGGGPWGAWIPNQNRAGEWVQVDLGKEIEVGKIATQGRRNGPYWVTQYSIWYSTDNTEFKPYTENGQRILDGNQNYPDTPVERNFDPPFIARYVRVQVEAFYNGWPSLRFELYNPEPLQHRPGSPFGISGQINTIPDSALSASTAHGHNWGYFGPQHSRLYSATGWSAWIPLNNRVGEWIQVDLGSSQEVGAVATQGRAHGVYWTDQYSILYSDDGSNFDYIMEDGQIKNFMGNHDANTVVYNVFETPVNARYIRLVVQKFSMWPALRWEVYRPAASWANQAKLDNLGAGVGVESGAIEDKALTASSVYTAGNSQCFPRFGRLNSRAGAGCWCAGVNDKNQWLQIETDGTFEIAGFAIQGRALQSEQYPNHKQWVTSARVSYSDDGMNFKFIKVPGSDKIDRQFRGNYDSHTVRRNAFDTAIQAKFVRIHPGGWYNHISMRVELYDTAARQAQIKAVLEAKRQAEQAEAERQKRELAARLEKERQEEEARLAAEKAAKEKAEREALEAKRAAEAAKDVADKKKAEETVAAAQRKMAEIDAATEQLEAEKKAREADADKELGGIAEQLKALHSRLETDKFNQNEYDAYRQELLVTEQAIAKEKTKAMKEKIEFDDYVALADYKQERLNTLRQLVIKFKGNPDDVIAGRNSTSTATVTAATATPTPSHTPEPAGPTPPKGADRGGVMGEQDPNINVSKYNFTAPLKAEDVKK